MKELTSLMICLCCVGSLMAQEKGKLSSDAISAKVLFIDYGNPNDKRDLDITNGLEIGYTHTFNRFLGFGIPVKIGVANVFGEVNNRNIVSVDGILRLHYQNSEKSVVVPYLFGGAGIVQEVNEESSTQYPVGGGLNFRLGKNSYIGAQVEYRFSQLENRDNMQIGLGYTYQFGKPDKDRDGVADVNDLCPELAGVASANGCPDADLDGIADLDDRCPRVSGPAKWKGCPDSDGDGIADSDDLCPFVGGTLKGCPDEDQDGVSDKEDKCPSVYGTARGCPDRDGDGVADANDECPDLAGLAVAKGCPSLDSDRDGVPDNADECPYVIGTAASNGCPDRDGDGIKDSEDKCPEKAGPYSGCPDTDGDGLMDADDRCPENAGAIANKGCPEVTNEVQEILDLAMGSVQFASNDATLIEGSFLVLDQIVLIMNEYPDYSMSISGHTDNVGDNVTNQSLSERRAETCYKYLIAKGIRASRLSYAGYGASTPIATNSTVVGRLMNRRVEFNMYIE